MNPKVELFYGTYQNFSEELYMDIRKETFGEDIGQNSWLTADEYRDLFSILRLSPGKKVLELASGSGGPAVYMVRETGCHLTGMEINEDGVNTARMLTIKHGLGKNLEFIQGDASGLLPFPGESFDVVLIIDAINHLNDRLKILQEFKRVLKPGGQLAYTDPIVVTGILTNEEIAIRSSIGFFLFVPVGENERLLNQAGFTNINSRDVTGNMASISRNWFRAREKRKTELLKIEEEKNYHGMQAFFNMVHLLSFEKRLSRYLYTAFR